MIIKKKIKTRLVETGTKNNDPQHEIEIEIDFSDCSKEEVYNWAAKDRIIVFQNSRARKLSLAEYMEMNGKSFKVAELCKSVKTTIVKKMTPDEMKEYIMNLPTEEKEAYLKQLIG